MDVRFRRIGRGTAIALWMVATLSAVACGGGADAGAGAGHSHPVDVEFTVIASDDFTYSPNELRVKAGQTVLLNLNNPDGVLEHDLTIPKLDIAHVHIDRSETGRQHDHGMHLAIHVMVGPGGSSAITFLPVTPGTYEFYCSVEGHRGQGMTGTLIVE